MKVGILGTGAYGIALALILNENSNDVTMWTKFESEKDEIIKTRMNKSVFPDVHVPEEIKITNSLEEVCLNKDIIIFVVPAKVIGEVSHDIAPFIKNQVLVVASKGIERHTCLFLNDVIKNNIDTSNLCVIAGGSFAIDIANKTPVGLSLASNNEQAMEIVEKIFTNDHFKLRKTNDIYGVEICSSIKNVLALAAGMLDGMNASESTKAMFLTESLHDVMELINKLGGDPKTILSFAGFGDILLTCTTPKSRNYLFGKLFVTESEEVVEEYKKNHTIEGLYTLESIHQLVKDKNVEIEIIDLIHDIIYRKKEANELFQFLIEKK